MHSGRNGHNGHANGAGKAALPVAPSADHFFCMTRDEAAAIFAELGHSWIGHAAMRVVRRMQQALEGT